MPGLMGRPGSVPSCIMVRLPRHELGSWHVRSRRAVPLHEDRPPVRRIQEGAWRPFVNRPKWADNASSRPTIGRQRRMPRILPTRGT